jgi:hypothetical protein
MSQREDASRPCPTLGTTYKAIHQFFPSPANWVPTTEQVFLASELVHWGISLSLSLSSSPAVVVLRHVRFPLSPLAAPAVAGRQLRRPIFISTHCLEPNPAMVNRRQVFLTRPLFFYLKLPRVRALSLANRVQQLGAGVRGHDEKTNALR